MNLARPSRRLHALAAALAAVLSAVIAIPGAAPSSAGARTGVSPSLPSFDAQGLEVVGFSDLGGDGLNGDIAVVGDTAVVASGLITDTGDHNERYNPGLCLTVSVKVVDVSDPSNPTVASEIPLPEGVAASEVDALRVETPHFSGDLAAIALDEGPSHTGPTACVPTNERSPAFVERGIEYYDIRNPFDPVFLGRYQADEDDAPPEAPPCGFPPEGGSARCATGQHSVDLVQAADGTVLSLSTQPGTYLNDKSSGPVRLVDVTDPTGPVEVGSWPDVATLPDLFSNNGCRPVSVAHSAEFTSKGTGIAVAFMDDGLVNVDASSPSSPSRLGQLDYATNRNGEGNAAYVTETRIGGRRIALLSEEDWAGVDTVLRVDEPATIAGDKLACEGHFTLFDPQEDAQIYERPDKKIEADIVYGGRGCPERIAGGVTVAADSYLADPSGKIVVLDRAKVAATQPNIATAGCRNDVKTLRAQQAGALAVVIARVIAPPFASKEFAVAPGGMPFAALLGGQPTELTIPAVEVDTPDGDALRNTLCPAIDAEGACTGGQTVTGGLLDEPGQWGGLRVVDNSDPAAPEMLASHFGPHATTFPPPDLGLYAPQHSAAQKHRVFVAWNSDGLRVLNLSDPSAPAEVASFVPPPSVDPTGWIPEGTYVTGVALAGDHILATDMNAGLYVVAMPDFPHARKVSLRLKKHLMASGRVRVSDDFGACRKRMLVDIQRRKNGRWRTVETVKTDADGFYEERLTDRAGRYRARAAEARKGSDDRELCLRAVSDGSRHRH